MDGSDSSKKVQGGEDYAQWEAARELAALLKTPPRFVTAPIHFMRIDMVENNNELSRTSYCCLAPLLRSDTFKAVTYYSAKYFYPERLKEHESLSSPRKLSALFRPNEFIALMTLTYFFRKMKRGCNKELFSMFIRNVQEQWMYSAAVGRSIEKIGFGNGFLFGALPQIAQCLFLGIDKKNFKPYRVHLRKNNLAFDTDYEEAKWGCNCLQIAVLMAQQLGLGRHYHDPFILGVGATDLDSVEKDEHLYAARLLQVWIDSLTQTGEAPDMMHRGDFYPFASDMARLKQFYLDQKENHNEKFLFDLGPEDITPELAPELHHGKETDVVTLEDEKLPDEVLEELGDVVEEIAEI